MEKIIKTKAEMIDFSENIASKIKNKDIILLNGDLGSGKTFFTNAFINYFNKIENKQIINVTSPTFNIVKTYKTDNFIIYHFDLYRIKNIEELYELDIEDAFNNISIIEWPNIIYDLLPKQQNIINININLLDNNFRKVIIK